MPTNDKLYMNEYMKDYKKRNIGQITITGNNDEMDAIKEYIIARGIKTNAFIKGLIHAEMQKHPLDQYTSDMPLNATKTPVESFTEQFNTSVQGQDTSENRGYTDVNRIGQNGAIDQANGQAKQQDTENNSTTAAQTEQVIKDMKTEIIDGIIAALQGMKA